jgi:hypothetical protein
MDRSQLVTIAVTTAVSVIIREVLAWLVALAKNTATRETIKATLRKIITKNRTQILLDVFGLSYGVRWFRRIIILDTHPLTRWEIVFMICSTVNILYWMKKLFDDSLNAFGDWLDRRSDRPQRFKE